MARRSIAAEDIASYATAHSTPPDEVQRALQDATTEIAGPWAGMQIGADQGAFMSVLVGILRPTFAVEVGTFTGYSSLAIAKALPAGGRLLCCDVSEEWTAVAREHWARAGVADRIELVIAPAVETLAALPDDQAIDFAFIDADKTGYRAYYEEILRRLSPTGVILIDNTLWGGQVLADSGADDDDTTALRALNDFLVSDERVEVAQLTVGDGVTMVRRR